MSWRVSEGWALHDGALLAEVHCPRCRGVVAVNVPEAWAWDVLRKDRGSPPWVLTVVDLTCPTRWGSVEPHAKLEVPDE